MEGNSNWALGSNIYRGPVLNSNITSGYNLSPIVGNFSAESLNYYLTTNKYTIVTPYQKALNNYKEAEKNYEKAINELNKFKTVLRDCIFNGNENLDFLVDIILNFLE